MIYISLICWILAACCNAVMDTLVHHYYRSIFRYECNPEFWNPKISWKNKYKNGAVSQGPAFFLSTGLLVAFTDAWHLFKSLQIVLLGVALVTFPYAFHICWFDTAWINQVIWLGILGIAWNVPFSLLYNRVLIKE